MKITNEKIDEFFSFFDEIEFDFSKLDCFYSAIITANPYFIQNVISRNAIFSNISYEQIKFQLKSKVLTYQYRCNLLDSIKSSYSDRINKSSKLRLDFLNLIKTFDKSHQIFNSKYYTEPNDLLDLEYIELIKSICNEYNFNCKDILNLLSQTYLTRTELFSCSHFINIFINMFIVVKKYLSQEQLTELQIIYDNGNIIIQNIFPELHQQILEILH
jgi:hypothetical protein